MMLLRHMGKKPQMNGSSFITALEVQLIISDAGTQRLLPASTIIQNGQYAVVTKDATTLDYWSIPSNALVVVLGSAIGNGLGNDGDVLYIKDSVGNEIDTVSWGSNTSAFTPSALDVIEGHSIYREDVNVDTNTATDWLDREAPNPGM